MISESPEGLVNKYSPALHTGVGDAQAADAEVLAAGCAQVDVICMTMRIDIEDHALPE